ncbi:MAG TPA: serine hydrolase domain-containing protein [Acidimicrobiales bacterium]
MHGSCDDAFGPVRDAFIGNFDQGNEVGASVAVTHHGRPVVDLWAGDADQAGRPWEQDTIVNVYSTTKTMAATCVLMLADRGEIDLDAPVADLWPEFGANGKAGVLVRHVMSHSAGLSGFEPAITATDLYDWDRVCELLAAQAPWWEPGAKSGYHAITQGYLQGELVRRATGRSVGTFFRDEVAAPLGADFHIGLPASEDHRVADLVPPDLSAALGTGAIQPDTLAARTLLSCPLDATEPRTRAWRGAEIPAAGGTGNARSVARVHSALACGGEVDGVRLMSAEGVERILEEQISGTDGVLGVPMRFGMGFGLMSDLIPLSPNKRAFFWGGWGGSLAVIDLDAEVSVAYVMNRMGDGLAGDVRGALVALAALGVATTLDA